MEATEKQRELMREPLQPCLNESSPDNSFSFSDTQGFTLIELLTAITIIGILAVIALEHFTAYEVRAYDARAEDDLRKAITAEEAYYAENESYAECSGSSCQTTLPGLVLNPDTTLEMTVREDAQVFDGVALHPRGDRRFRYSSESGSLIWNPA